MQVKQDRVHGVSGYMLTGKSLVSENTCKIVK